MHPWEYTLAYMTQNAHAANFLFGCRQTSSARRPTPDSPFFGVKPSAHGSSGHRHECLLLQYVSTLDPLSRVFLILYILSIKSVCVFSLIKFNRKSNSFSNLYRVEHAQSTSTRLLINGTNKKSTICRNI